MCFFHLGEFSRASACLQKALSKVNAECKMIHEISVQEKRDTIGVDDNSDDDDHCGNIKDDDKRGGNNSSSFDDNDDNNDVGDDDYDEGEGDRNYDCDGVDDSDDSTTQTEDTNIHEHDAKNSNNNSSNSDRDDAMKQSPHSISTNNIPNTVINASKTKKIDADIQHDEPTQLEKNQSMKEKILTYIGKTEKKIEIEKINELKRKKAMQKVFSSTKLSPKLALRTKEIRGNMKVESAKHHQLKKRTILTVLVDFICLLYRFFMPFIVKKKD